VVRAGSYRDEFGIFDEARSDKKNIFVVAGASHYDLSDKPEYVDQAVKALEASYKENLYRLRHVNQPFALLKSRHTRTESHGESYTAASSFVNC
jgi:hypothetical protein